MSMLTQYIIEAVLTKVCFVFYVVTSYLVRELEAALRHVTSRHKWPYLYPEGETYRYHGEFSRITRTYFQKKKIGAASLNLTSPLLLLRR